MNMREDMIDFPVSDDWRDFYYEIGLTSYPSPKYVRHSCHSCDRNYPYVQPATSKAQHDDRIEKLAQAVKKLAKEVAYLRNQLNKTRGEGRGKKGWQEKDGTS